MITLDELTSLGLKAVAFREGVPVSVVEKDWNYELRQPREGYGLFDAKWIKDQQLAAPDAEMEKRMEGAHKRFSDESEKSFSGGRFKESKKLPGLKKDYHQRRLEYENFRPSVLREQITNADIAVIPSSLIDAVKAQLPDARLAVLEDGTAGNFQLYASVVGENYPRVLVRAVSGKYGGEEARVDDTTINLLFREEPREPAHSYLDFARFSSDPVDPMFYGGFRGMRFTNPVKRSGAEVKVKLNDFAAHKLENPGFWGMDEEDVDTDSITEVSIYGRATKFRTVYVPYNNQGLGAKVNGYRIGKNGFIEGFRKGKERRIKEIYQRMWTQPLDSLEEVLDRQNNIGRLVEDNNYSQFMNSLEESINLILEPYLHLSAMSKLLGSVLLKSKWGSFVAKQAFYDDFTRIAGEFVQLYEKLSGHLSSLNPDSRELRILLAPLRHFAGEEGKLKQAYDFLNDVVSRQPKNFDDLSSIFAERLRQNGATLIPELEKYNPLEDITLETIRIREGGVESILGKLQEAHAKLVEYKPQVETLSPADNERLGHAVERAKASGYRMYRVKKRDGQVTYLPARELEGLDVSMLRYIQDHVNKLKHEAFNLDSRRSPQLETLLNQFYSRMPVSEAEQTINYLDYVGTRLAAYNAMAAFFKQTDWTRPEVVLAEQGIVEIRNGWYPLTRLQHGDNYVRNDTVLTPEQRIEILDGTNSGGKTIDVRKALFIATLALTGCYVPAEYAKISFFSRIRFRLKQTGMQDQSALISEVNDISEVLSALGTPILVGLDETFTSTNDREGEALTYGLIRRLAQDGKARAIITSHYPTLHDTQNNPIFSGAGFSHFSYQRQDGRIIFPHKKILGPNLESDYAIPIAENEGLNPRIIAHAKRFLEK
ncbi:MAG: hypothetical protein AABX32_02165 [Nanoarchaeota archaeon]